MSVLLCRHLYPHFYVGFFQRHKFSSPKADPQLDASLFGDSYVNACADPAGGGGTGGPDPPPPHTHTPGIARLLIFAMLKFSVRPLLGIWTPPEKIFWIRAWNVCYSSSKRF